MTSVELSQLADQRQARSDPKHWRATSISPAPSVLGCTVASDT